MKNCTIYIYIYIGSLVQDCSNSSALAMELLQSWIEPSIGIAQGKYLYLVTDIKYTDMSMTHTINFVQGENCISCFMFNKPLLLQDRVLLTTIVLENLSPKAVPWHTHCGHARKRMGICLYVYVYTYITCHHWHRKSFVIHSTLTHWCLGDIVCLQYMYCYEVSFAICDIMDQRIRWLQNPPKTFQELTNTLVEVWRDINLGTIHRLVRSIPPALYNVHSGTLGSYPLLMSPFNMIEWMVAIMGWIHIAIITLFFYMISGFYRQFFFLIGLGQLCSALLQIC